MAAVAVLSTVEAKMAVRTLVAVAQAAV